ncbi:tubby-F-box-like protein, partial [Trifolium medium]|nr:tubby-F-box-like protein [Trifolium medium]
TCIEELYHVLHQYHYHHQLQHHQEQNHHHKAGGLIYLLRARGPRKMQCTMLLIPISSVKEGGTAPTPLKFTSYHNEHESSKGKKPEVVEFGSTCTDFEREPLILNSKAPRWHEQLLCWCLYFRGRVTVASVKNFQHVAAEDPWEEKVILQFGKIGDDTLVSSLRFSSLCNMFE